MTMTVPGISLDEAVDLTRTGDVWLFRGHKLADRAIQMTTNSPVNHVGMTVALDDLPPLMWHAELGKSLLDVWSGNHHRGVQLHDLRSAVTTWATKYGQRGWLRQLDRPLTREMEDALLRTIARLDGTPFPSTAQLVLRWLRGRAPEVRRLAEHVGRIAPQVGRIAPQVGPLAPEARWRRPADGTLETAYCAEVVASTYTAMGLLPDGHRPCWYDPGRFWSGDELDLSRGYRLGGEIPIRLAG